MNSPEQLLTTLHSVGCPDGQTSRYIAWAGDARDARMPGDGVQVRISAHLLARVCVCVCAGVFLFRVTRGLTALSQSSLGGRVRLDRFLFVGLVRSFWNQILSLN